MLGFVIGAATVIGLLALAARAARPAETVRPHDWKTRDFK
jgi:hypothetical protein